MKISISEKNDYVRLDDDFGNCLCELRNSDDVHIMYVCEHPRFGPCVVASIRDEVGEWHDKYLAYKDGSFHEMSPAR